ncbi:S-adenosyl-L-methionine-dependent methyltransferase [Phanerochaete sordida]|uniref:S-adenosyl-L-methionine-dependent methyltransferase n=1 Tax=Phanerochaete sordida TaxID=48140 RepID=A0A9P3FXZ1_9APHY|nr:S-adenosyl-L-methionine-dependent methyltransferase [Phanerochaete sordida]
MATSHNLTFEEQFAQVRKFVGADPDQGWDDAWKAGLIPWDAGEVQPALRDLLNSGELKLPKAGRALVPGCGKGYDGPLIASATGLDTLSVDISSTAVEQAKEYVSKLGLPDTTRISYELKDFFTLGASEDEKFDLVYDYTFFPAIPPSRRGEWGQVIRRIVKPGGYLVALAFPIDPPREGGPPFFVRPEHYVDVIGDGWEKVIDKVPETSLEGRAGRERLLVWKKL